MVKTSTLDFFINKLKAEMPLLRERFGVQTLGLFGSYVRGEQTPDSDLDILVSFAGKLGLLKFIELENYISEILGVEIDLVMRDALKPRIGERILSEVVSV